MANRIDKNINEQGSRHRRKATIDDSAARGSFRVVTTFEKMFAIPHDKRKIDMEVRVQADSSKWKLISQPEPRWVDTTIVNWESLDDIPQTPCVRNCIYVDPTEGDDIVATTTPCVPFKTPAVAIAFATIGDTIIFCAGKYHGISNWFKEGIEYMFMDNTQVTVPSDITLFDTTLADNINYDSLFIRGAGYFIIETKYGKLIASNVAILEVSADTVVVHDGEYSTHVISATSSDYNSRSNISIQYVSAYNRFIEYNKSAGIHSLYINKIDYENNHNDDILMYVASVINATLDYEVNIDINRLHIGVGGGSNKSRNKIAVLSTLNTSGKVSAINCNVNTTTTTSLYSDIAMLRIANSDTSCTINYTVGSVMLGDQSALVMSAMETPATTFTVNAKSSVYWIAVLHTHAVKTFRVIANDTLTTSANVAVNIVSNGTDGTVELSGSIYMANDFDTALVHTDGYDLLLLLRDLDITSTRSGVVNVATNSGGDVNASVIGYVNGITVSENNITLFRRGALDDAYIRTITLRVHSANGNDSATGFDGDIIFKTVAGALRRIPSNLIGTVIIDIISTTATIDFVLVDLYSRRINARAIIIRGSTSVVGTYVLNDAGVNSPNNKFVPVGAHDIHKGDIVVSHDVMVASATVDSVLIARDYNMPIGGMTAIVHRPLTSIDCSNITIDPRSGSTPIVFKHLVINNMHLGTSLYRTGTYSFELSYIRNVSSSIQVGDNNILFKGSLITSISTNTVNVLFDVLPETTGTLAVLECGVMRDVSNNTVCAGISMNDCYIDGFYSLIANTPNGKLNVNNITITSDNMMILVDCKGLPIVYRGRIKTYVDESFPVTDVAEFGITDVFIEGKTNQTINIDYSFTANKNRGGAVSIAQESNLDDVDNQGMLHRFSTQAVNTSIHNLSISGDSFSTYLGYTDNNLLFMLELRLISDDGTVMFGADYICKGTTILNTVLYGINTNVSIALITSMIGDNNITTLSCTTTQTNINQYSGQLSVKSIYKPTL